MEKVIYFALFMGLMFYIYKRVSRSSRLDYLQGYRFHPSLRKKLQSRYPHLSDDQVTLVFDTLRDYFHICNRANQKMVAMPSQVVDVAWHEFILSTRLYKEFCAKALGKFLHHTPTEVMKSPTSAGEGIKRAWQLACKHEQINPSAPERLPMLFGIDALLNIPDGYTYVLDCKNPASPMYGSGYCASDIGCSSGCGGDSGDSISDGFGDSSCGGSSCGGSCGGD